MAERAPKITAIVLAAGRSERMGSNKLLADLVGKPLIRHGVEMLLESSVYDIIVVTGNEDEKVRTALHSLDVAFAHNPNFAEGLSTSLKIGLNAVSLDADGALIFFGVCLDRNWNYNSTRLFLRRFSHHTICVPIYARSGNPYCGARHSSFGKHRRRSGRKALMASLARTF